MISSALKTKEVIIGENKYTIILFPAMKALKLQIKLAKILGAVAPGLMALEGKKIDDIGLEEILGNAIKEISSMSNEREEEVFELAIKLLSSTHVNGLNLEDQKNFDSFFTGNLNELWRIVAEVVKANFFSKSITKK
jgi:hypothetical protein